MDCIDQECNSEAREDSNYCKPCFDKVMQYRLDEKTQGPENEIVKDDSFKVSIAIFILVVGWAICFWGIILEMNKG